MASTAGGPPPPPSLPPPPGASSFDHLPAELLLEIWEYLDVNSSMQFALALFPTLRRHSLIPQLTLPTYMRIIRDNTQCGLSGGITELLARLPMELWLQIAELGNSRDNISLMFALAGQFFRFQGRASKATKTRLYIWSRRKQ
ncbi:hypothetical protein EKO04_000100 [Ascochyta lentis]|uniref:F-box domain-containing protein n=1 Tax=Ascochyta lentis TaxID=205686 RepID=A0A8H7MLT8_9PLEO|nr:hypothetical protein EKO04_000100 [Ascochyta lentis]